MNCVKFLIAGALSLLAVSTASAAPAAKQSSPWWSHAVIYEIYLRSFQDSNGDGIGDLNGVTQRLDYLQKLGVDALWITPFFPSPNADFGYDVSNYTGVAKEYGTMADWDRLAAEAKKRHIRILLDFVINHTSEQHPWFIESRSSKTNPKRDWYVWRDGKPDGSPPSNWRSIFTGGTWDKDAKTGQYYYHIFLPQQPDLNWANPQVRKAMYDVARFWLKRGASGFRLDATPYLFEDPNFPDDPAPLSGKPSWLKPYNAELPKGHEVMRELRSVLNSFPGQPVLLGESATATLDGLRAVYGQNRDEVQLPMDFLVGNIPTLDPAQMKARIDEAQTQLFGQTPTFFFSSHDRSRQWSKYGDSINNDQIAKLMATLTLLQRGTTIVYYGEELGMGDAPQAVLNAAPLSPKRPRADDRDVSRTPMQWSGAAHAGFSTATPWLPVSPNYTSRNVQAASADSHSVYSWYAKMLRMRHDDPVFRDGAYVPMAVADHPMVYCFARRLPSGRGAEVCLNMGATQQSITLAPGRAPLLLAPYGISITHGMIPKP